MADGTTPNAGLAIITPTRNNWADTANNNFKILDALVGSYFVVNALRGIWENSTAYAVNDSVIDSVGGTVWRCFVAHTSAAVPAVFSDQRVAHPTYWSTYTSPARSRGVWVTATSYAVNDFVVNGNQYAICLITHTSGTFATDLAAGKWAVIADFTADLAAAAASAAAAAVSASGASTSATNAATSASTASTSAAAASTSAGNALTSQAAALASASAAATSATTSSTQAAISTTQANAAAASALAAAAYAAALVATSTTSLLIAVASRTFTTQTGKQFAAGQFISAVSAANNANFMHGQVTSYSATTLVVNVTDIGGSGTLGDWNLSISGSQGSAGVSVPGVPVATATGSVNAITATYSPVLTLTDLTLCALVSIGANTSTTPTFSPDGLTARTITARGGSSLAPGDIGAAGAVVMLEYNLANTRWELLNPSLSIAANGMFVNSQTVAADYTVASGYNALSAGPITINGGVTVTVTSGSNWAVV